MVVDLIKLFLMFHLPLFANEAAKIECALFLMHLMQHNEAKPVIPTKHSDSPAESTLSGLKLWVHTYACIYDGSDGSVTTCNLLIMKLYFSHLKAAICAGALPAAYTTPTTHSHTHSHTHSCTPLLGPSNHSL